MEPVFIHDCDDCVYSGTEWGWDMYFCPKMGTKVVRYGDEGPDYVSSSNHTFGELFTMV